MIKERPGLLNVFIIIMVFNALVTAIHYILIYQGVIQTKTLDMVGVVEFTYADIIANIIPSAIGAYGLWRLKVWGWALAMILSGGYMHGMIVLLTRAVATSQFGSMPFIAIYILMFSMLLITYLWQQRRLFT
ncbi:MAG TPA: hypothetical protein VE439_07115 [Anaerolineae bacterium]|nr:hypothetical protein [Anaerolineae bacterium]